MSQPKAYLIAEIEVHDPAAYEGYKAAAAPLIEKYGGRYLVRGGDAEAAEGDAPKGRVIVLEFPDMTAVRAFLEADEYQPVAEIRHKSASSRLILAEGIAP